MPTKLETALAGASPRIDPMPTPWFSMAIHGAVAATWILLCSRVCTNGALAWSAGFAFIAYDTFLIGLVFVSTLRLLRRALVSRSDGPRQTLGIIVAAHNEAAVLPVTLRALFRQADPPDVVLVADDGSNDETAAILTREFGLSVPLLGTSSAGSIRYPTLRWMRLPHGGKARALNAALIALDTDLVVTVDGDTLLDAAAVGSMREAFSADPDLVAATGVLTPICGPSWSGRFFELFQTYEYIRNFLTRYTWARMDALLLVSGAFAGFRREAVLEVGGFDPVCMVEDYELIHRLRRYGRLRGYGWTTSVVGGARAITEAPASAAAFLRQRRRWFCGFLQTQYWYRDMVGNPRYGRLGLVMLPIKAFDTLQPLYGLVGTALLFSCVLTGRAAFLVPVGAVLIGKIVLDFAFHLWSIELYRRWVDPGTRAKLGWAVVASLAEPFTFQVLRQVGATLGWVSFLTRDRAWGRERRAGLTKLPRDAERSDDGDLRRPAA